MVDEKVMCEFKTDGRTPFMLGTSLASLLGALLITTAQAMASGQSSANFVMKQDAINSGIGDMASANFKLLGSIGDAVSTGSISSVSFQLRNGFRAEVGASPAVLNLLSVISRKLHAGVPFDLTIDKNQLLSGNVTVEPRAIGAGHNLIFHFDGTVSSVSSVTALDALLNSAATATFSFAGNDVTVTLANVADDKRLTVAISGLNGTGTAQTSLGFLVGDVNSSRSVNASDIAAVKAHGGKPINATTYIFDLNADGSISPADVAAVKSRAGKVIP